MIRIVRFPIKDVARAEFSTRARWCASSDATAVKQVKKRVDAPAPGEPATEDRERHLVKGTSLARHTRREDVQRVFALVRANQAALPVRLLCRVFDVSASGFCAWRDRAPSERAIDDATTDCIRGLHAASDATYGIPRIRADLIEADRPISRKRAARLMRRASLCGVSRQRVFVATTQRDVRQQSASDLFRRAFVAERSHRLWVADMDLRADVDGLSLGLDGYARVTTSGFRRTRRA